MQIKKIAHLADIHIEKNTSRHAEYREQFKRTEAKLKKDKPDLIVVAGDLAHNWVKLETECLVLMGEFLTMLASIAPVRITRGNHDISKHNIDRTDIVEAVTKTLNRYDIIYLDKTGMFPEGDNVMFAVWHYGDGKSPWDGYKRKKNDTRVYIDLYHDPIRGCKTLSGGMDTSKYPGTGELKGDLSMLGDIHLYQTFANGTKAYASSLIQQNFGESVDGHGYLLWDLEAMTHVYREVPNDSPFVTVTIESVEELAERDFELGKNPRVRVLWFDFRSSKNKKSEREIRQYFLKNHNAASVKVEFKAKENSAATYRVSDADFKTARSHTTQAAVMREHLVEANYPETTIEKIMELDREITQKIFEQDKDSGESNEIFVRRMEIDNFMSYGPGVAVDWDKLRGVVAIAAPNRSGKTTLLSALCWALFGETLYTGKGKSEVFNLYNNCTVVRVAVTLSIGGVDYLVERKIERRKKRTLGWTEGPVQVNYAVLDKNFVPVDSNNQETNIETKKTIEKSIGTFDDFVRNNFVTGDVLNKYINATPAEFIDALMRDMGLQIYETKLEVFKKYRKDLEAKEGKIVLDIDKTTDDILELHRRIASYTEAKADAEANVKTLTDRIANGNAHIEGLKEKLTVFPFDETVDVESLKRKVGDIIGIVTQLEYMVAHKRKVVDSVEADYPQQQYDRFKADYDAAVQDQKNALRLQNTVLAKIRRKEELTLAVSNITNAAKADKTKHETELQRDCDLLASKQEVLNGIEDSLRHYADNCICDVCGSKLNTENEIYLRKSTELKTKAEIIRNEIHAVNQRIEKRKGADYNAMVEKYKALMKDTKAELTVLQEQDLTLPDITAFVEKQESVNTLLQEYVAKYRERDAAVLEISEKSRKIDLYKNEMANLTTQIAAVEANQTKIEENARVRAQIAKASEVVEGLVVQCEALKQDIVKNYVTSITILDTQLANLEATVDKWNVQQEREALFSTYQHIVHRDGLPSALLKKSVPMINEELDSIMEQLPFKIGINDDLKMFLTKKDSNIQYKAIQGSGAERTYSAIALKFATREINSNVKYNIMLLDECFDKLDDSNKELMKTMMGSFTNYVDTLCIITHDETVQEAAEHLLRPVNNSIETTLEVIY